MPKLSKKTIGRTTLTQRGFELVEFKDRSGVRCSLQQSSAIGDYPHPGRSMIWLGPDDADPKILHGDARRLGINTTATEGWVDYPIPPEVFLSTHMHLTRDQVADLISNLRRWLATGSFNEQ